MTVDQVHISDRAMGLAKGDANQKQLRGGAPPAPAEVFPRTGPDHVSLSSKGKRMLTAQGLEASPSAGDNTNPPSTAISPDSSPTNPEGTGQATISTPIRHLNIRI